MLMQLCGGEASEGIFIGTFLSMSSTAVVSIFIHRSFLYFLSKTMLLIDVVIYQFNFNYLCGVSFVLETERKIMLHLVFILSFCIVLGSIRRS